ncbi:putative DDE superfamily endonuclease [Monocercomonoides exilis]|uniref:putative DDE superfamily endonuclease n=1 Tax=Monocercomonoides exilis TaxID=2049356 RepID=UPI00355ABCEB|nr:putative DDE superfamily endonuclease [Monocercomonoides exilis]|eukprot:MONOS_10388.1-p1 / transcript=MONOS_10388.1 / gene=MONOS_10388 / organism=Monocercomonoides_exilis_PA203 / gene_product=unspecified product / transcript_product=unspecified product / location=Mono_scaffold00470:41993-42886(-) / protein_length=297 / sequence_SO=supercontig / SO=protein_coding / is_pseudo=false
MTGFTKSEFDLLVRLVQPEIYPHPGKRRVIEKLDDQLFLLLNFFHFGSPTVSHLITSPFLKTQDATIRLIHSFLQSVKVSLSDVFLTFRPDRIRGMEEVALVLDCTVLPVNKTGKEFNCGSDCFSGKHKIYCVKVEVGVNPKTGTASTVSKVHGGAVHDYVVFREHYSQFAARLDGGKIMADSAYIGAKSELGAIITKPVGTPELAAHREIVERFFGRLKTLFTIFRRPWPLKISSIAEYFYVAFCLTNYHILQNPLSEEDFEANQLFLSDLITKAEQKRQKKELANEKYKPDYLID